MHSKYIYFKHENRMIVALCVDDIVIKYNEDNIFENQLNTLKNNFDIKDLKQP